MSIYVGDQKATLYKGNYLPFQLYRGEEKIGGYALKTFSGDNFVMENTYNYRPEKIVLNGIFPIGKNLLDMNKFAICYPAVSSGEPVSGTNKNILRRVDAKNFLEAGKTYTISYEAECVAVPEDATLSIGFTGFYIYCMEKRLQINLITREGIALGEKKYITATFTIPEDYVYNQYEILVSTDIYLSSQGTQCYSSVIFTNIQLEEGTVATEYEPYQYPPNLILNWNGTEIDAGYGLLQDESIVAENYTAKRYYKGNVSTITSTDFGRRLAYLKTSPLQHTVSLTNGTIEITARIPE